MLILKRLLVFISGIVLLNGLFYFFWAYGTLLCLGSFSIYSSPQLGYFGVFFGIISLGLSLAAFASIEK